MLRLAAVFAVVLTASAHAAAPPPDMQRPLAAGERYYDPGEVCAAAMPDYVPAPRSYVEKSRRVVWPTAPDAAETVRMGLEQEIPRLDDKEITDIAAKMLHLRDWGVAIIEFEAQNIYGATVRSTAHCLLTPIYGKSDPQMAIGEVRDPRRCRLKSLCGVP